MNRAIITAKEVIRHLLTRTGASIVLDSVRSMRGVSIDYLTKSTEERFDEIYKTGAWSQWDPNAPGSGLGSALKATETIRQRLPSALNELGAQTLLDVGCGDFTWMREVSLKQSYIGVDIVQAVIERNIANFETEKRKFIHMNCVVENLPDADAVLCREILFHLSFSDAKGLLKNILKKSRHLFIATSDSSTYFNADIRTGDFRLLNLRARPFKFPEPLITIDDSAVAPGRILGVWLVSDIAKATGISIDL